MLDHSSSSSSDDDGHEGGGGARLRLSDIRTTDEGEYKCEITFLDVNKNCPVVQLVKLTTLGENSF